MISKRTYVKALVVMTVVGLLSLGSNAFAAQMTIRFAHGAPPHDPRNLGALEFKRVLEAETGGKVEVNVFPAGQLGADKDLIEALQVGGLEITCLPPAFLGGFQPLVAIMDIPYLFPVDIKAAREVIDGAAGKALFATTEKIGVHGLSSWEGAYKHFTANKPLRKPADFSGMKFRVMPSPILMAMIESLGSKAITIPYTEVYMALQTKTVDGQEANLESIYNMKFHEVQKYLSLTYHIKNEFFVLGSKMWWDKLSPELKASVDKAILAGKAKHQSIYWERENKARVEMGKQLTVLELKPEEIDALKETTAKVKKIYVERYGEQAKEMLGLFEKEIASKTGKKK